MDSWIFYVSGTFPPCLRVNSWMFYISGSFPPYLGVNSWMFYVSGTFPPRSGVNSWMFFINGTFPPRLRVNSWIFFICRTFPRRKCGCFEKKFSENHSIFGRNSLSGRKSGRIGEKIWLTPQLSLLSRAQNFFETIHIV